MRRGSPLVRGEFRSEMLDIVEPCAFLGANQSRLNHVNEIGVYDRIA